jgi:hypothetical protein
MTETASNGVSYEFYDQTGKWIPEPNVQELSDDVKRLYCVAIVKGFTDDLVKYGYCHADEDDTSNSDIVLEDPVNSEDVEFMKNVALGRLVRRPTTTSVFDPSNLVLGPRIPKPPKAPKPNKMRERFSATIAQTLLQELTMFQRTFIQRRLDGSIRRIICMKFAVHFCVHGATLRYGASINHADYGSKIMESEIESEVVKLMETARVRYEKFPKVVQVPKFSKLKMDDFLINTVRKFGCFQKPTKPGYAVWNK